MSFQDDDPHFGELDTAPGEEAQGGVIAAVRNNLIGLGLATLLTATSFYIINTRLVWHPSIPVAIVVLAVAQMGVHLVFFLHITTGPESTNNVMALAFGVLIVLLLIGGSLWIMDHLNENMMIMSQMTQT